MAQTHFNHLLIVPLPVQEDVKHLHLQMAAKDKEVAELKKQLRLKVRGVREGQAHLRIVALMSS